MADDYSELYNTPLSQPEQDSFNGWVKAQSDKVGYDVGNDAKDYDLQGYWQKHVGDTEEGPQMGQGHLTDEFKKPNHPTFSDESKYHGVAGHEGGHWSEIPTVQAENGQAQYAFKPGATNLEHHQPNELQDYFGKVEQGNQVILPKAPAATPGGTLGIIHEMSKKYGLNPAAMAGMASIESSMDPNSNRKRITQYKGLYQIGTEEWRQFGSGDIYNAKDNAEAMGRMTVAHRDEFQQRFGREPTNTELYMIHQQGMGHFTRGALTNVAGNPYPGMSGPQTPESFRAGWGRELNKRMLAFAGPQDEMQRQGVAELPPMNPGFMSVKSDVSNLPQSGNIDDRRQPGPIQRIKDAVNDTYLAGRAVLGLKPLNETNTPLSHPKNPDESLGSVQQIRDRLDLIRERHQQAEEAYNQAHADYRHDSDEYLSKVDAYSQASGKYHQEMDAYLANFQKALKKGQGGQFTVKHQAPQPPVDLAGKHPNPENYFGDLSRLRTYDKLNPE